MNNILERDNNYKPQNITIKSFRIVITVKYRMCVCKKLRICSTIKQFMIEALMKNTNATPLKTDDARTISLRKGINEKINMIKNDYMNAMNMI